MAHIDLEVAFFRKEYRTGANDLSTLDGTISSTLNHGSSTLRVVMVCFALLVACSNQTVSMIRYLLPVKVADCYEKRL